VIAYNRDAEHNERHEMAGSFSNFFGGGKPKRSVPKPPDIARIRQAREPTAGSREAHMAHLQQVQHSVDVAMTPERRELIRRAMEVQRARSKILDDLNDENKRKLYALAIKTLLREDAAD
jgi:hypothetical protein